MTMILVLGAGFVAGPLVRYFLEFPEIKVRIADVELPKARALAGSHPRAEAVALDLKSDESLKLEIAGADLVVSLVPYAFHPVVAKHCIAFHRNMVTTSYASEAMKSLDADARRAGITLLNEVGLDPGIDHMEAMRVIHRIGDEGGTVLGFTSWCGGLPAPESNTNPFGYKFSWSPRGVLLAGTNAAHYLKEGRETLIPGPELFAHYEMVNVEGLGTFEGYPNRDSLSYAGLYGIPKTRTMFRGTLRYPGWCATMKKIADVGLLGQAGRDLRGKTFGGLLRELTGLPPASDLKTALPERLRLPAGSAVLDRWEWLGLLAEAPIPLDQGSPLEVLEGLMLDKLRYAEGERDMIILRHEFRYAAAAGGERSAISTLIDYGLPGGDSSMARTVGLPAAVGAKLVLDGRISRKGVCVPIHREIYGPILRELEGRGLVFQENEGPAGS
jgi:saccharopine dehydrogenase (NADP+, L-glutamate forming)/spermidine synthase